MAIGVAVNPRVIVAGRVVSDEAKRAFVEADERAQGVVGDVDKHDVTLFQEHGAQIKVRYFVKDKLERPVVGQVVAIEAEVREYGSQFGAALVAIGPAFDALDKLHSALAAPAKG